MFRDEDYNPEALAVRLMDYAANDSEVCLSIFKSKRDYVEV